MRFLFLRDFWEACFVVFFCFRCLRLFSLALVFNCVLRVLCFLVLVLCVFDFCFTFFVFSFFFFFFFCVFVSVFVSFVLDATCFRVLCLFCPF